MSIVMTGACVRRVGSSFAITTYTLRNEEPAMNSNWRGQYAALFFFGAALMMIWNPQAFPVRTWFNSLLGSLFSGWS
jgi:hypothetical protein